MQLEPERPRNVSLTLPTASIAALTVLTSGFQSITAVFKFTDPKSVTLNINDVSFCKRVYILGIN